MPNKISHFDAPSTGVERACQIARNLFNHARGNHETDADAIAAIARQSQLTPATLRRFLQPSRRPKDVSFTIWERLLGAYRRYLARELAALQDEIDRLAHLDPADAALEDLLRQARALVSEVESVVQEVPAADGQSE